eukprot:TRINITY_DN2859_c0_g1_i2.p1 TRINITY_DN2859_c0_g1~~TRINITY_DN2859_c0_g1_i2.p1  ORF type:complete len:349 (+),score=36.43 TRINITY_DN2859_c0_g1_i2:8-1054(+)
MRCGLALFRLQGQFGFQFGSGVAWHRSRRRSSVFVVVLMFSSMASQRAGMRLARTRMIHLIVVAAVVIFGRQTFDALGRLAFAGLASTGRRREQIRITSSTGLQAEPPRVVLSPIPKVYVYDHCPFCVRVRLALGLKNIKHEARFMMNDDQDTPISLLGKKIAPIWEHDGHVMGESMDIIKKVDSDAAFGEPGFFKPASGREDLKKWQSKFHAHMRILQRPRYVHESSVIPEFQQREAREYFIKGHLIPYPEDFDTARNCCLAYVDDCACEMVSDLASGVTRGDLRHCLLLGFQRPHNAGFTVTEQGMPVLYLTGCEPRLDPPFSPGSCGFCQLQSSQTDLLQVLRCA